MAPSSSTALHQIKVYVKIKPLSDLEKSHGLKPVFEVDKKAKLLVCSHKEAGATYPARNRTISKFTGVYGHDTTANELFHDTCAPDLHKIFEGYSVGLMAYGQTGAGKSHTMTGPEDGDSLDSVVGLSLNGIFAQNLAVIANNCTTSISVSYVELHLEELRDLLDIELIDPGSKGNSNQGQTTRCSAAASSSKTNKLSIREEKGSFFISGQKEIEVTNLNEAMNLLREGLKNRTTCATKMNKNSSRSHSFFTVKVSCQHLDGQQPNTTGSFKFIDLAGAERMVKSGATGSVAHQGININRGLLALGNVISALSDQRNINQPGFISYRDSKLTKVLQDILGGGSICSLMLCISASETDFHESMATLGFGSRALKVKSSVKINLTRRSNVQTLVPARQQQTQGASEEEISKLRKEYREALDQRANLVVLINNAVSKGQNIQDIVSRASPHTQAILIGLGVNWRPRNRGVENFIPPPDFMDGLRAGAGPSHSNINFSGQGTSTKTSKASKRSRMISLVQMTLHDRVVAGSSTSAENQESAGNGGAPQEHCCHCQGFCCNLWCGCKKLGQFCTQDCRCSSSKCLNKAEDPATI